METLKLKSTTKSDLEVAKKLLTNGEVVAIPTETVYGLGANALNSEAISKIFIAKGRPQDNPLIVHISNYDMLKLLVCEIPPVAKVLMDSFWGGPLTLIFKKSAAVPDEISRGLDTVAIRFPAHKVALKLIEMCGFPIAAPSANTSGRPSTTNGDHVFDDLNGKISAILYDEQCTVGLESTVLDITLDKPRLLRPGGVTREQIEQLIGEISVDEAVFSAVDNTKKVNSPGMKYKHYAPKADVLVLTGNHQKTANYIKENSQKSDGILCFDEYSSLFNNENILTFGSFENIEEQAKLLFLNLRKFDDLQVSKIYAQCPNDTGLGLAIANRLKKASGFNILDLGD